MKKVRLNSTKVVYFCKIALLVLFMLLAGFTQTQAQTTGSLTGVVSDEQGATVSGATVTIISLDRNQTVGNAQTTGDGSYTFPSLIPGNYKVVVERNGFSKTEVSPITIEINTKQRADITIKVGNVGEVVNVQADTAPQIERDTSGVGTVIGKELVKNLPLFERDPTKLILLAPGVSSGQDISVAQLSVNGSRTSNNEYTIDGVSVINGSTGGASGVVSVEALREFRIQTSTYSAEFGRTSGATITAVVDSGTNKYHGSLYEYFRNEKLNANNYFNNSRRLKRQVDRFNQFGGTFGGPVPFVGKNTFFFFNYEGLRRSQPNSITSTVPTNAFRNGDFSGSLGGYICTSGPANPTPNTCSGSGTPVPVNVTYTDGTVGQARVGQLFRPSDLRAYVGNIIPQTEWDAAAKAILSNIPVPNLSGVNSNFVFSGSGKVNNDQITARIDHNFNADIRIFGRYSRIRATDSTSLPNLPGLLNNSTGLSTPQNDQLALGYSQNFSANLINEFNFGLFNDKQIISPPTPLESPGQLGFQALPQLTYNGDTNYYPPLVAFAGNQFTQLGINSNTFRRQFSKTYSANDAVTIVKGSHTIKTGVQLRWNNLDIFNPGGTFAPNFTITGNSLASPITQIAAQNNQTTAFAAFLLGRVDTAIYTIPQPPVLRKNYNIAFFAQDDWKVTPKLTLNLGLRYDYESPMTVKDNIYSRVDQNTGKLLVAGANASKTLNLKGDKINFGPRVGFAYSWNEKTVFRGAYGLFYSQVFSNLGGVVAFPGFTVTQQFNTLGGGRAQAFPLSQGIPLLSVTTVDPFAVERNATVNNPLAVFPEYYSVSPLPETHQWSLGVQRVLPFGFVADAAYIGARSTHLPYAGTDYNAVPPSLIEAVAAAGTNVAIQNARPFPTVGTFASTLTSDPFENVGTSTYHAGQFKLSRRFEKGFGVLANYTFSKSIDDGSGIFNSTQPEGLVLGIIPTFNRSIEKAVSAFDRTHVLTMSFQFESPFGKGKYFLNDTSSMGGKIGAYILGGWQLNSLTSIRSGLPLTVIESGLTNIGSNFQQRPNSTGELQVVNQPGPNGTVQYFQGVTSANFPYIPTGPLYVTLPGGSRVRVLGFTPGTVGRNTLRTPASYGTDLSLVRRFSIKERMNVNFRIEAFNVFNQTTLLFSNTNVTLPVIANSSNQALFNPTSTFGQTTSAAAARRLQLVARFEF